MDKRDIVDFKNSHTNVFLERGFEWKSDSSMTKGFDLVYADLLTEGTERIKGDSCVAALHVVFKAVSLGVDPARVGVLRLQTRKGQVREVDHAVAVLVNTKGVVEIVSDCRNPSTVARRIKDETIDFISAKDLVAGCMPRGLSN